VDEVKGHGKEAWGNAKDTASDLTDSSRADASVKTDEAKLHAE